MVIPYLFQHPNYGDGPGFSPNDIAITTCDRQIPEGPNVRPALLPSDSENPGGQGWITGWGRICGQYHITIISIVV